MPEVKKVGISDYQIAQAPDSLQTLGLGSCVAVFIYDKHKKIGGLSHIMLPNSHLFKGRAEIKVEKFADLALPKMVTELKENYGCTRLVAKIAGGANMFSFNQGAQTQNIGERNVIAVQTALKDLKIPLLASHVGGTMGRSFFANLEDLTVTVKMVNREIIEL
ncbi:chemotaxis protein CheD [Vagococcus penaei]|uniref:Probable chemoreceptor glutamine deamidase CheD n=1 Tax=Vagococcus penaei TaxID=633807 RepID=A0A1Q2D886_9ENTE|nr:chemotaxis protein CheD [Vagococcus penaei]AQP54582.1 chemotaxis protein CheD [Vagococcus penaei]RSU06706.1 chemotaxis protein CheD [Vagococcus penaei]